VNTVVFTVSAVAIKFVLGMAVALVLNQQIRARNFFRAFLLLPWAMPAFVVYLVWRWLYDPLSGLINYALIDLGLITNPIAFLSDRNTAMLSVIIAHFWRNFPSTRSPFSPGCRRSRRSSTMPRRSTAPPGCSSSGTSRCRGSTTSSGWWCC
jgi:ABC-type sugar transport system permease subunit